MKITHNAKLVLSGLALSMAFMASPTFADTTDSVQCGTLVDAKKAKEIVDSKSATIVDTRKKVEFSEERIPGAISIVYDEKSEKKASYDKTKDKFDMSQLTDKNKSLLVYCNGPECWRSYKACKSLVESGYKNVNWFRTGIPAWKAAGYPTEK